MAEKNKNETEAKNVHEQRIKETRRAAIEENIRKAEKSGNTLSQTIDDNDNLVGVENTSTVETSVSAAAAAINFSVDDATDADAQEIYNTLFNEDVISKPPPIITPTITESVATSSSSSSSSSSSFVEFQPNELN